MRAVKIDGTNIARAVIVSLSLSIFCPTVFCQAVEAAPTPQEHQSKQNQSAKMLVISGWGTRLGSAKIYVSDLGIRIKSTQGGSIWPSARPRRALLVNDENKCFLIVRSRDFKKRYNHMTYDFTGMRTASVSSADKIATKLKLQKVTLKPANSLSEQKMGEFICVKNSDLPVSSFVLDFYRDVFWGKNAPKDLTPVGMQEFGRRFHESKPGEKEDERRWEWIKTLVPSKVEIVDLQRGLFRKPAGFRRAKDAADLYFSQGGDLKQSDLQDLFQRNLDIEDKDGDKERDL